MKNVVYVTGNANKAKYFSDMVGIDIPRLKLDVDEIQSLDLREIVEHKARQAYKQADKPILVEDTKLSFNVLGALPGSLIKWFIEELGLEGVCRLLDSYKDRGAVAGAAIAYFDGHLLEVLEKELPGSIADKPRGDNGFGWNQIFIPDGTGKTLGEMSDEEFRQWYVKIKPFKEIGDFLNSRVK